MGLLSLLRRVGDSAALHTADHLQVHTKLNRVVDAAADFGVVGDGSTDNGAAIVAAIAALGAAGGTVLLPAGTVACLRELIVPDQVELAGAGIGATILSFVTDLGWGKYAIQPPKTGAGIQTARPLVRDMHVRGPGGQTVAGGRTVKMNGVYFGNNWDGRRLHISGFGYGAVMGNDHGHLYDCKIGENYVNVCWPDGQESKGNHAFVNVICDGPYFASIGCFGTNTIDGVNVLGGHGGVGPYGLYKGDGGWAARTVPTGLAATPSASGGTLTAASYTYTVTAYTTLGVEGESFIATPVTAVVTGSTGSVALTWTAVAGATGYRVYRGVVGDNNVWGQKRYFIAETATNSYTDTNAVARSRDTAPSGVSTGGMVASSTFENFAFEYCGNGGVLDESTGTGSGQDSLTGVTITHPGYTQGSGTDVRITGRPVTPFKVRNVSKATIVQGNFGFEGASGDSSYGFTVGSGTLDVEGFATARLVDPATGNVAVRIPGGGAAICRKAESTITAKQLVQHGGGGNTIRPFGSFGADSAFVGVAASDAAVDEYTLVQTSGVASIVAASDCGSGSLVAPDRTTPTQVSSVPGSFFTAAGAPVPHPVIGYATGGASAGTDAGVMLMPRGRALGYVAPAPVTSLPTAAVTYRGQQLRIEGGAGVADVLYECRKKADNTYEWRVI